MKKLVLGGVAVAATSALAFYSLSLPDQLHPQQQQSAKQGNPVPSQAVQTAQQPQPQPSAQPSGFNIGNLMSSVMPGGGCWTLYQNGMAGEQVAYISPQGAKVINNELGMTSIVKAPDFNVIIFSPKSRTMYQTTMQHWQQEHKKQAQGVGGMGKAMGLTSSAYQKGRTAVIAGLNATEYFQTDKSDGTMDDAGEASRTEMWFTEDIKTPQMAMKLMNNGKEGLPSKGVLLRMVVHTKEAGNVTILDTTRSDRSPIPDSAFTVPTGYKPAVNEYAVLMGNDGGSAMVGLMNEFGKADTQKDLNQLMKFGGKVSKRFDKMQNNVKNGNFDQMIDKDVLDDAHQILGVPRGKH
jgi:hypothetical protein